MRRGIVALGLLMCIATLGMSQGAKVINAYNYLNDGDLLKAKGEIEPATQHAKTSIDGKTWYYRGQIYEQLYFTDNEKFADHKEGSLLIAVESFAKAKELGSRKINMNDVEQRYQRLGAYCYQEGVNQFNKKDFAEATKYFEKCYSVKHSGGVIDSAAIFNVALSSRRSKDYDKAIEFFNKAIDVNFNTEEAYVNLANTYKEKGDDESYTATLARARKALPNSQAIVTAEIDVYLANKEFDKALENLNVAIQNDPENQFLFFARGNILDNQQADYKEKGDEAGMQKAYEGAKADYTKALGIDPDYFDAAYSIGALHYNHGAEMLNKANEISDDNEYKKAKTAAEEELKRALPFLEKAHELNATDVSTMTSLKELYARTNNMDKYNEMNEKLNN